MNVSGTIGTIANLMKKSPLISKNGMIRNFFDDTMNYSLFTKFINSPTIINLEKLDNAFKKYYMEARLVKYFSELIYYHSINYDKEIRKYNQHNLLMFKQDENQSNTFMDLLHFYEPDMTELILLYEDQLINHIEDKRLYQIYKKLSIRQRQVLGLYCIHSFSPKEISVILKVSPQFVYKILNKSLKKMRSEYRGVSLT